ncbi:MarR family transcriptional regulator [Leptospira semungkisensis]|uniref:MarR family transcriptional regulator n=1 Tax=Leptospira semungkisensis TaxID=2484985 RepID=A0A4R9G5C6_9LEPT|nr:MarR family transcriptional regulator [Leptospira semungkisensis]TGK06748.1 MarR family transcriptional regulator [Leptospira semungkisensis]
MQDKKIPKTKAELLESILNESRNLGTVSILFHQTVADRLGLHITDHKCVDLLFTNGPQTAGEIAKTMGLSTGAVTSLIDRLEKKGLVERKNDPNDRRKVRIFLTQDMNLLEKVGVLFEGLGRSVWEQLSEYTADELKIILDYVRKSVNVMVQERNKLLVHEESKIKENAR